jgi:cAMP-dependent protein kinase regulator
MSVSAEVFGKFNLQKEYTPPVHQKTPQQIEAIKSKMSGNFMFNSHNPKDKKAILDAVKAVQKKKGEVIIKQGDDGDNFYILESGALDCYKLLNPTDAEETFLKEYKPGESFGELALLYNAPRAATIKCKSDQCELWSLERETFNHIIKTAVQKKRDKYDEFLEKVQILKSMQKYERTKLADAFKEQWFEDGDVIIKEGDTGNDFYLIMEGDCIATKVLEPGKPAQTVKEYSPGSYFGERALLKDEPRAASIIAKSQVCVVSLERLAFKRLMGPLEEILGRNEEDYKKYC